MKTCLMVTSFLVFFATTRVQAQFFPPNNKQRVIYQGDHLVSSLEKISQDAKMISDHARQMKDYRRASQYTVFSTNARTISIKIRSQIVTPLSNNVHLQTIQTRMTRIDNVDFTRLVRRHNELTLVPFHFRLSMNNILYQKQSFVVALNQLTDHHTFPINPIHPINPINPIPILTRWECIAVNQGLLFKKTYPGYGITQALAQKNALNLCETSGNRRCSVETCRIVR